MREALAIGRWLLERGTATTQELIDVAHTIACAWRRQQQVSANDSQPLQLPDEPESDLFCFARSIADQLYWNCERAVQDAGSVLDASRSCMNSFAADVHLFAGQPTAPLKVFLSHAREDADVVRTVERRLSTAGIDTWLDTGSLAAGGAIPDEIASNIRTATHFLLFNSVHSRGSAWVARECSLAFVQQVEHGAPQIVPLLLDATSLPDHLVDRNGISFDDFSQGMAMLWPALGIPEKAVWSISQFDRLRRRFRRLIEVVKGCSEADPLMTVDEETFEELEEAEGYVISLALEPEHARFPRFLRTTVTYYRDDVTASFNDDLYTVEICYSAGIVLLRALTKLSNELVNSNRAQQQRSG